MSGARTAVPELIGIVLGYRAKAAFRGVGDGAPGRSAANAAVVLGWVALGIGAVILLAGLANLASTPSPSDFDEFGWGAF